VCVLCTWVWTSCVEYVSAIDLSLSANYGAEAWRREGLHEAAHLGLERGKKEKSFVHRTANVDVQFSFVSMYLFLFPFLWLCNLQMQEQWLSFRLKT
jgi:hypothetical protein